MYSPRRGGLVESRTLETHATHIRWPPAPWACRAWQIRASKLLRVLSDWSSGPRVRITQPRGLCETNWAKKLSEEERFNNNPFAGSNARRSFRAGGRNRSASAGAVCGRLASRAPVVQPALLGDHLESATWSFNNRRLSRLNFLWASPCSHRASSTAGRRGNSAVSNRRARSKPFPFERVLLAVQNQPAGCMCDR